MRAIEGYGTIRVKRKERGRHDDSPCECLALDWESSATTGHIVIHGYKKRNVKKNSQHRMLVLELNLKETLLRM
jgi:hypothetical protein